MPPCRPPSLSDTFDTMRALTFLAALALVACGDVADQGVYELPEADAGTDATADAADAADDVAADATTADAADDCDYDGDGFKAAKCGGPDCCDSDPNVRPNQAEFFDVPSACGTWDYNCSGEVEREHNWPAAECKLQGDYPDVTCVGGSWEGFRAWRGAEPPGCGELGTTMTGCTSHMPPQSADYCRPSETEQVVQRCR